MDKKRIGLLLVGGLLGACAGIGCYILVNGKKDTLSTSIKIDEDKEYVYAATYDANNLYTEYKRYGENVSKTIDSYGINVDYSEGMQYLSNLSVPYINIDSNYALEVNHKLEELYLEYADMFDECSIISSGEEYGKCTLILTYKIYTYQDILSIVVIDAKQSTSPFVLNYHVYNISLTTGEEISYDSLLTKLGLQKEDTLTKIESLLKEKMDEVYSSSETLTYDKANEVIENEINNGSVLAFTSSNGDLNVLAIAYFLGAQNGQVNRYLLTVDA